MTILVNSYWVALLLKSELWRRMGRRRGRDFGGREADLEDRGPRGATSITLHLFEVELRIRGILVLTRVPYFSYPSSRRDLATLKMNFLLPPPSHEFPKSKT